MGSTNPGEDSLACQAKQCLSVGLVVEKRRPRSKFKPYMERMPPAAAGFHSFAPEIQAVIAAWTPDFTQNLDASIQQIIKSGDELRTPISFEEASWAQSMINTRYLQVNGSHMMFPGFDFINHRDQDTVTFPFCSEKTCTAFAKQDIAAGEQIFAKYAPHSNFMFLAQFGFVPPENNVGPRLKNHQNSTTLFSSTKALWLTDVFGCPSSLLDLGPILKGAGGQSKKVDGTLHAMSIKCLFYAKASDSAEDAKQAKTRQNEIQACLPYDDPSSCTVKDWKAASKAVHQARKRV